MKRLLLISFLSFILCCCSSSQNLESSDFSNENSSVSSQFLTSTSDNNSSQSSSINYDLYDFDWEYNEYETQKSMEDYTEEDWEEHYSQFSGVEKDGNFVYCFFTSRRTYTILRCLSDEKEITIPDSFDNGIMELDVTNAYPGAFYFCKNLETIRIGKNFSSFNWSLSGCHSLKNFIIDENNEYLKVKDGALYSKDESVLYFCPASLEGKFVVDDDVYGIDQFAFSESINITELSLGAHFHERTSGFPNLINPLISLERFSVSEDNEKYSEIDGVLTNKTKDTLVKYPCGRKGEYRVPISVKDLGIRTFNNCLHLTALYVDGDVQMSNVLFYEEKSLTSIIINNNPHFSSIDGVLYSNDKKTLVYVPSGKKEIVIDEKTEIILNGAIANENINFLSIPDSVKTLESHAIRCSSLKQVVLGNGVASIEDYAFGDDERIYKIESLCYKGTVEQLMSVEKSINNAVIAKAQRYYYSENKPTKNESHFWHYVDNNPVIWQ